MYNNMVKVYNMALVALGIYISINLTLLPKAAVLKPDCWVPKSSPTYNVGLCVMAS